MKINLKKSPYNVTKSIVSITYTYCWNVKFFFVHNRKRIIVGDVENSHMNFSEIRKDFE